MKPESQKCAVIAGAGPAGLTCALELLRRTDYIPIILEKDSQVGGLSKTVVYKNNRLDIGGHRFFSKSQRVLEWWHEILPFEEQAKHAYLTYQNQHSKLNISNFRKTEEKNQNKFLLKSRKSRIYYNNNFFDYPVTLNVETLKKLGLIKTLKIIFSYIAAVAQPMPEVTLEDFYINRFGRELYETFFKTYTEKVWGKPCTELSAEWGKQRVKGISLFEVIKDFFTRNFKKPETSLIQHFLYPPQGPGQLWEIVAEEILKRGGKILLNQEVVGINLKNSGISNNTQNIHEIIFRNNKNKDKTDNAEQILVCDLFFSTMPIQYLVPALRYADSSQDISDSQINFQEACDIATNLEYRDFITVGILVSELKNNQKNHTNQKIVDNWIYIHEPGVNLARIQIFNNWSEEMVHDTSKIWLGLEYITDKQDKFWNLSDQEIQQQAIQELIKINFINQEDVLDAHVVKVEKAYPVYAGSYKNFETVKNYVNSIENLFLLGRNGMHRYNNQDHSMLTAMTAVDMIEKGNIDKSRIWNVNTEDEYHEQK